MYIYIEKKSQILPYKEIYICLILIFFYIFIFSISISVFDSKKL